MRLLRRVFRYDQALPLHPMSSSPWEGKGGQAPAKTQTRSGNQAPAGERERERQGLVLRCQMDARFETRPWHRRARCQARPGPEPAPTGRENPFYRTRDSNA